MAPSDSQNKGEHNLSHFEDEREFLLTIMWEGQMWLQPA